MKPKDYINKKAAEEALKAYQGTQLNNNQETSPYFVGKINADRTKITDPTGRVYNLKFTGNPKEYELAQRLSNDTAVVNATPGKTINVDGGKSLYILGVASYQSGTIWILHKVGTDKFNYLDSRLASGLLDEGGTFSPSGRSIIIWDVSMTPYDPDFGFYTLPGIFKYRVFKNWRFNSTNPENSITIGGVEVYPIISDIVEGENTIPDTFFVKPPIPSYPTITPVTDDYEGPTGFFNLTQETETFYAFRFGGTPSQSTSLELFEDSDGNVNGTYYFYAANVRAAASSQAVCSYRFSGGDWPQFSTCDGSTTPVQYPTNSNFVGILSIFNATYRSSIYKVSNIFTSPEGSELLYQEGTSESSGTVADFNYTVDTGFPGQTCVPHVGEVPVVTQTNTLSGVDGLDVPLVTDGPFFTPDPFIGFNKSLGDMYLLQSGVGEEFGSQIIYNYLVSENGIPSKFSSSNIPDLDISIILRIILDGAYFTNNSYQLSGRSSPFISNGGLFKQTGVNKFAFLGVRDSNTILISQYSVKDANERLGFLSLTEDDFNLSVFPFRTKYYIEDGFNKVTLTPTQQEYLSSNSYYFRLYTDTQPNVGLKIFTNNNAFISLFDTTRGDFLLR